MLNERLCAASTSPRLQHYEFDYEKPTSSLLKAPFTDSVMCLEVRLEVEGIFAPGDRETRWEQPSTTRSKRNRKKTQDKYKNTFKESEAAICQKQQPQQKQKQKQQRRRQQRRQQKQQQPWQQKQKQPRHHHHDNHDNDDTTAAAAGTTTTTTPPPSPPTSSSCDSTGTSTGTGTSATAITTNAVTMASK